MNLIDPTDQKILEIIKEDSRLSSRKIAKKAHLPITTVYNRLKKMEKEEIIKKYSVVLDHKKLGQIITVYILVHYNISVWGKETTKAELHRDLLCLPCVEEIKYITGEYDIMLKAYVKDMDELNNLILVNLRKIPGIGQTQSIFVLEDVK